MSVTDISPYDAQHDPSHRSYILPGMTPRPAPALRPAPDSPATTRPASAMAVLRQSSRHIMSRIHGMYNSMFVGSKSRRDELAAARIIQFAARSHLRQRRERSRRAQEGHAPPDVLRKIIIDAERSTEVEEDDQAETTPRGRAPLRPSQAPTAPAAGGWERVNGNWRPVSQVQDLAQERDPASWPSPGSPWRGRGLGDRGLGDSDGEVGAACCAKARTSTSAADHGSSESSSSIHASHQSAPGRRVSSDEDDHHGEARRGAARDDPPLAITDTRSSDAEADRREDGGRQRDDRGRAVVNGSRSLSSSPAPPHTRDGRQSSPLAARRAGDGRRGHTDPSAPPGETEDRSAHRPDEAPVGKPMLLATVDDRFAHTTKALGAAFVQEPGDERASLVDNKGFLGEARAAPFGDEDPHRSRGGTGTSNVVGTSPRPRQAPADEELATTTEDDENDKEAREEELRQRQVQRRNIGLFMCFLTVVWLSVHLVTGSVITDLWWCTPEDVRTDDLIIVTAVVEAVIILCSLASCFRKGKCTFANGCCVLIAVVAAGVTTGVSVFVAFDGQAPSPCP